MKHFRQLILILCGWLVGFFKQFLLSGATGSDPVGEALKVINAHLAEIDQHLDALDHSSASLKRDSLLPAQAGVF